MPADVDPLVAVDVMITMVSPELYLAFRVERGWTHQQTIDWMSQTVPVLMLRATLTKRKITVPRHCIRNLRQSASPGPRTGGAGRRRFAGLRPSGL
jgi:hypothetical protein